MDRYCDSCKRQGNENKGTKWCSDCGEGLCDTCVKYHVSNKYTKDHTLTPGNDTTLVQESDLVCHEHRNKELEAFCFDHEKPCCIVCSTEVHRHCKSVTVLDKCAKDVRSSKEFSDLWKLLKELESELEGKYSTGTTIKEDLQKLQSTVRNTRETLLQKVSEFDRLLEALGDKEDGLDKQIDSVEKVQGSVLHCIHVFEKSMNYASEVHVFLRMKKMEIDAEAACVSCKAINQFDEFKLDSQFETVVSEFSFNVEQNFKSVAEVLQDVSQDNETNQDVNGT